MLAANYGNTSAVWTQGDFNYDGTVNVTDFNILASNFNATPIATQALDTAPVLGTLAPEPASLSVIALGAAAVLGRRRRK